jgi:hypothetical protein
MTTKADFNAEEWETITAAPLLAALQVASAERGGQLREGLAAARVYAEARQHAGGGGLLDELVSSPPALDQQRLQGGPEAITQEARLRVRQAVSLLEEKATPEELADYRKFVLTVAEAAAEAHREGGFLGIGSKPVSEKEQAALDDIRTRIGA